MEEHVESTIQRLYCNIIELPSTCSLRMGVGHLTCDFATKRFECKPDSQELGISTTFDASKLPLNSRRQQRGSCHMTSFQHAQKLYR